MRVQIGKMTLGEIYAHLRIDETVDVILYKATSSGDQDEYYLALTDGQWERIIQNFDRGRLGWLRVMEGLPPQST